MTTFTSWWHDKAIFCKASACTVDTVLQVASPACRAANACTLLPGYKTAVGQHCVLCVVAAGTVPMHLRQDALAAASETVTMIEATCQGGVVAGLGQDESAEVVDVPTQSLVCTVGSMTVHPGQVSCGTVPTWCHQQ